MHQLCHAFVSFGFVFQSQVSQDTTTASSLSKAPSSSLLTDSIAPSVEYNRSESTGGSSTKERKDGRVKKKSSWFNSLYPTYKSRSEDFKRIFKDVPDEERLVVGMWLLGGW